MRQACSENEARMKQKWSREPKENRRAEIRRKEAKTGNEDEERRSQK